jgi:hypothetical protein
VLPLIGNWCAHARVVIEGGTGLLEQQSGLPIGARRMTCAYERARGQTSMRLADNALDFYDRNCVDCAERQPVGIPNLLQLVEERERAAAERVEVSARARAAEERVLEERARHRATVRAGILQSVRERRLDASEAHAATSLLDMLHAFDAAPSPQTSHVLQESTRAVPAAFTPEVESEIARVADAGGDDRTEGALAILNALARNERQLFEIGLRALARGEAVDRAAATVERLAVTQYRDPEDNDLIVLAVLDTTPKTSAPGLVGGDIELRELPSPTGGRSVLLGVVVIRGNLATPSSLSR